MRIDSHQHFWELARGDYNWLTPDLAPLYRDHLPTDLIPLLKVSGIDRTILVQAAASCEETRYLLTLADEFAFIAGVVGWVDLEDPAVTATLRQFAQSPKFCGIRPMLQDIDDPQWVLRPDVTNALAEVSAMGLTFDALVKPVHLPIIETLLTRLPKLKLVIDHGAKPDIVNHGMRPWAKDLHSIARNTSACCKLSGLVTEAGADASAAVLKPYVDSIIDMFGPARTMWGSDWPVLNLACDYAHWQKLSDELLQAYTNDEQALIMGDTARQFYSVSA